MSFWKKALDVTKNVATAVVGEIETKANELRELKQKYEEKNDDELLKIAKNDGAFGNSSKERSVAASILKKRGYSVEELKS
ncbi:hypothetical protein [Colwellia sp. E2M01]|uniref:hypothetical protein n=1 Tax=Colwellia sp. E2M01 TaxID=2841561 RepID=UPI001C097A3B|nr:hypothetical protein [Colwellia sp. E2M01]MBU2870938.1 hypothetical protein [Colwellia sp. E2M01]